MHIDLWADVACPWCYLGINHFRKALAEFEHRDEVEVLAHAWFIDPELDATQEGTWADYLQDAEGMAADDVPKFYHRLQGLGDDTGIRFDFDHLVVTGSSNAHRVIAAARDYDAENGTTTGADTTQLKLIEAIDRSHFEMGLDISTPEVLVGCAQDVGLPAERAVAALADPGLASEVFSDFQVGAQMGIEGVPTFLVERQLVFSGAQPVKAFANALETAWQQTQDPQQNPQQTQQNLGGNE